MSKKYVIGTLLSLMFGAILGCGSSNEVIQNEIPKERPPRPVMGGEKVKGAAPAPASAASSAVQ